MRANGKSTYQIKKEKLQKIKTLLQEIKINTHAPWTNLMDNVEKIWELVKDE